MSDSEHVEYLRDVVARATAKVGQMMRDAEKKPELRPFLDHVSHIGYYDRLGQPISAAVWAMLKEDIDYTVVANDYLPDGTRVSTLWLGIDHGFTMNGAGVPIIFETMVFGGPLHREMYRYATEELALEGHAEMLTLAQLEADR